MGLTIIESKGQNWLFKCSDFCIKVANHGLNGSNRLLNRCNVRNFFIRKGSIPFLQRDN